MANAREETRYVELGGNTDDHVWDYIVLGNLLYEWKCGGYYCKRRYLRMEMWRKSASRRRRRRRSEGGGVSSMY